jgi:2,4-diaminopentanoate dehydrogenase
MAIRVLQWTTGHVGREAVKAILAHPELELVGAYAWSPEKEGRDVGELCGVGRLGVTATGDVDALLARGADCVCYTPNHPELDVICRLLAAGLDVVASNLTNCRSWGEGARARVESAAQAGGATLFGSGIFPGFANYIAAQMASVSHGFRRIRFLESVDVSTYQAIRNYANLGWGQPPAPQWLEASRRVLGFYGECLDVMAQMLRVPVAETRFDCEWAITPEAREVYGFRMPAGSIAGQKSTWTARVAGQEEPVLELDVCWIAGRGLEPEWPIQHGYTMEVDGDPNVRTRVTFSPSRRGRGLEAYVDMSNTVTAMPVVAAIPTVYAAAPGIRTYADLPLITARYVSPSGA